MKISNPKKTAKSAAKPIEVTQSNTGVRVVKAARCPSLSGKSDLAYEFGMTEDVGLHLRITANSGKGSFRQEWTGVGSIRAAIDKPPRGETITSDTLMHLFRNESANMPSFVFAVLLHEGLVRRSLKEKRRYERVEPASVDAALKVIAEGKGVGSLQKGGKSKAAKTAVSKPKKGNRSA